MSNTPVGISEIQRWPKLVRERVPDRVVVVNRDGIIHAHGLYRPPNVVDVVLESELRRVHTDYHQAVVPVLLSTRARVRKCPQPVDAGEGPELNQHDLPAQVNSGQRRAELSQSVAAAAPRKAGDFRYCR